MTDLEMAGLCAEAMGLLVQHTTGEDVWRFPGNLLAYDPLRDDAHAMALVKKFGANICQDVDRTNWYASVAGGSAWGKDLNRAIVECVAKMQSAKALTA